MERLIAAVFLCFSLIQSFETDDCSISIVENSGGKSIIKQIKDPSADEQFLLVIDAVACSIAEEMKIAVNHVALLPPAAILEGKKFQNLPASLHSLAPGFSAEEKLPWIDFDIHQKLRKEGSSTWEKWGALPEEETGLTPAVIHHMSLHPDLADLVALDTYVGNADRSRPNIFFDEKTHSFCGIDMAASFNSHLPQAAIFHINRIIKKEIALSPEEIVALNSYRITLQRLIQKFPPDAICARLEQYATQAGFYPGSALYTQDVQDRMTHHQRMIRHNYQDSLYLIDLMNSNEFIKIISSL
ncbi:MAG TPA: hypothetical protein VHK67_03065 [Rhabdochlamydiaceae bacterium]|jgi:hypothetical protein|nr:hypothetical protein [Rhabdochlamydiaceae bacterium]